MRGRIEARFTQATYFTRADRRPEDITLFVIHTAECGEVATAAESLATWGARPDTRKASWHYAIDNDSITQSVRDADIAWHAGPINGCSIGIELAGRASQTPEQWADAYSTAQLDLAARFIAQKIREEYPHIPVRRLTPADLAAGERHGFCGHVDVAKGLKWGANPDPGAHFPWESFLDRVRAHLEGGADEAGSSLREPSVLTPEIAVEGVSSLDFSLFVPVEHGGETWLVCPIYVAPVGIGEAAALAAQAGCQLPTPGLVDAIWRAADLRMPVDRMVRTDHDGTPATMDSPAIHARQAAELESFLGARSLGRDFRLLAGAFKDVVEVDGRVGLYGWTVDEQDAAQVAAIGKLGLPLYQPVTPGRGRVVQPFYARHVLSWKDYSQGLRLVRRA